MRKGFLMSSQAEFLDIFRKEGSIGCFFVERFGGKLHHDIDQVGDFIVSFPSKDSVPSVAELTQALTSYYEGMGYELECGDSRDHDCFEGVASFRRGTSEACCFGIIVTGHYPFHGHNANLRVSIQQLQ